MEVRRPQAGQVAGDDPGDRVNVSEMLIAPGESKSGLRFLHVDLAIRQQLLQGGDLLSTNIGVAQVEFLQAF